MLATALGAIAPWSFAQAKPVRVGMLSPRPLKESVYAPGVVRRLAELGYRPDSGMSLEYRSTDGFAERYETLARELIDLKCDIIFAIGTLRAVTALRDGGTTAPLVFLSVDYDPVSEGIVKSLRRPEGNITGVYQPTYAMVAKRIEILREVRPAGRRFLVLTDSYSSVQVGAARSAAEAERIDLTLAEFSRPPYDYRSAFEEGRKAKVEAVVVLVSPVFASNIAAIAALALKHRLPSIGSALEQAQAGLLLSFNVDAAKLSARAAEVGVRILKGAKPADIPVEQADEFELAVNAKTARALGVKIPESVFARATRIVQ